MTVLKNGAALFAGSTDEFVRMAPESSITTHPAEEFKRRWGTVTESEMRSWRNSLTALARVVDESTLQKSGVAVELRLPLTDRRIDASFVAHDRGGHPHVVLVELKQWEGAGPSMYPDNVVVGNLWKIGDRSIFLSANAVRRRFTAAMRGVGDEDADEADPGAGAEGFRGRPQGGQTEVPLHTQYD